MTDDPTPRTPRGQDRAATLIDAALRIIVREGPAAVTHRTVAREAGAAHGSVAYYFGGREELMSAALTDVTDRNVAWLSQAQDRLLAVAAEPAAFAGELASLVDERLVRDRAMGFSVLELHLAAARDAQLQPLIRRWGQAYAEACRHALTALGSQDVAADTRLLVQGINGMILEQLSAPREHFRRDVLEPTLRRLVAVITGTAVPSRP